MAVAARSSWWSQSELESDASSVMGLECEEDVMPVDYSVATWGTRHLSR